MLIDTNNNSVTHPLSDCCLLNKNTLDPSRLKNYKPSVYKSCHLSKIISVNKLMPTTSQLHIMLLITLILVLWETFHETALRRVSIDVMGGCCFGAAAFDTIDHSRQWVGVCASTLDWFSSVLFCVAGSLHVWNFCTFLQCASGVCPNVGS